jgi:hypothetical protein
VCGFFLRLSKRALQLEIKGIHDVKNAKVEAEDEALVQARETPPTDQATQTVDVIELLDRGCQVNPEVKEKAMNTTETRNPEWVPDEASLPAKLGNDGKTNPSRLSLNQSTISVASNRSSKPGLLSSFRKKKGEKRMSGSQDLIPEPAASPYLPDKPREMERLLGNCNDSAMDGGTEI